VPEYFCYFSMCLQEETSYTPQIKVDSQRTYCPIYPNIIANADFLEQLELLTFEIQVLIEQEERFAIEASMHAHLAQMDKVKLNKSLARETRLGRQRRLRLLEMEMEMEMEMEKSKVETTAHSGNSSMHANKVAKSE
jgi:hypothetical protein